MSGNNGPSLDLIARQEMSIKIQSSFTEEVAPNAHRINYAIKNGKGVGVDFWLMISRFDEYIKHVGDEFQKIVVLDNRTPKIQLFRLVRFIHFSFLTLGNAIGEGTVGEGLGCSDSEYAQDILADAEELLDESEEEYENASDVETEVTDDDE
ncbi:hypothetical protein [Natrinema hispanicum]|uniref:Uncharacterized protein n=1 Tax=Natrinema hispanicum TaxID=392421 RepID=A0A1G6VEN9_9EURY|nr:hypothetical protein [Natrinema hispanicum]SDD51306.1 hypothetical protein SAMN05192552_102738 [Natrinema hispanicum]SEU04163.1 hypothetical protein SAMN04488694_1314 [Natrinema hispanicum]